MKTFAALLALAPAAPAVACDHAPVALAAPQCACPDPNAFAASSVQTYAAPVVQLAPVVQSYQSAVVALPTVTHSYSASSFGASSGYSAFSSGHNAYSFAQLQANRHAEHAFAQARFGNHSLAAVAGHRGNDFDRAVNRAVNRNLAARRQLLGRPVRQAVRREGIITRGLRAPGRILGGLFGR